MKKFKNIKLMLIGLCAVMSVNAFAQEKATTVWRYTDDGTNATLIGFVADLDKADKADVTIPDQVTDPKNASKKYWVTAINEDAFSTSNDKGNLKKLTINASKLESIPEGLVKDCANLAEIDLTGATSLGKGGAVGIPANAFKGTKIAALDLSKTQLTNIYNYFDTRYKYTATGGSYSWEEANDENTKKLLAKTPKISDPIPTVNGDIPGTDVFGSHATAYAYNLTLPGAKQYGDNLPYTRETANAYNAVTFTDCVDETTQKEYTAEDAAAYNLKLDGAMPYGFVLDAYNYATFNSATGQNKVAGDELTNADVDAYNATLTGAKAAGDGYFEEDGITPIYYTTDEAYEYNMKLGLAGLAIEGNENPAGATNDEIDAWNLANVPGACDKGDAKPSGKKYTSGTGTGSAYEAILNLCTKYSITAITEGQSKAGVPVDAVANKTLTSLVLPKTWTAIVTNSDGVGAFENCVALATVDFTGNNKAAQSIGDKAFLGTKVASLDFTKTLVSSIPANLVIDQDNVEENTTLTSVKLNTAIVIIPAMTFMNCTALSSFSFATDAEYEAAKITKINVMIGQQAFAYTALTSFTLPAIVDETTANQVKKWAFEGCESLKDFTYLPAGLFPKEVVNLMAFPGCVGVKFHTTSAYITNNLVAPKNTVYDLVFSGYSTEFITKPFKDKAGKFYIKYVSTANIRVDKTQAKVYNAYLEDGDQTLVIQSYKTVNGFYEIAPGATVLVITDVEKLEYEPGTKPAGSSWIAEGANALKIVGKGGVSRAALDAVAGVDKVVYGWVSSATKGTGFMKITTGSTFDEGTMYAIAAEPEEEGRVNVVWRDEFGNVESDPTSIETIKTVGEIEDGAIYNLQGVRMNKTQKGLYIKNGQKYVVK